MAARKKRNGNGGDTLTIEQLLQVLIEETRTGFESMREGFRQVNARIDQTNARLDNLIETAGSKVRELDVRVTGLEARERR